MIRLIGTIEKDDDVLLYYAYTKSGKNFFKFVTSPDGFEFNGSTKYVIVTDPKGREDTKYDWKNFNISHHKDHYAVAYKANGGKAQAQCLGVKGCQYPGVQPHVPLQL